MPWSGRGVRAYEVLVERERQKQLRRFEGRRSDSGPLDQVRGTGPAYFLGERGCAVQRGHQRTSEDKIGAMTSRHWRILIVVLSWRSDFQLDAVLFLKDP